jgi:hypothetical protein
MESGRSPAHLFTCSIPEEGEGTEKQPPPPLIRLRKSAVASYGAQSRLKKKKLFKKINKIIQSQLSW